MQTPPEDRVPWWKTELGDAEVESVTRAIRQRHIHHGPVCRQLEEGLAERLGLPYVVSTTSGSVALLLSLLASDVGPADEVLLPALTFIAPAHAAKLLGAGVRIVDVRADRPLIDVDAIEAALTPRTRAIVVVHMNGRAADIEAVARIGRRRGVRVVEDCAQAFLSRGPGGWLGTQGDVAAFSLGLTKLMTTGEGGFVATRDRTTFERLVRLRNHGVHRIADNRFDDFGCNFRMTDIQAAVGLAQLERLDEKVAGVRRVYDFYRSALPGIPGVELLKVDVGNGELPLWSEALVERRDAVLAGLAERGVDAKAFHPCLAESHHLRIEGRYPNATRFADAGVTLPSGPDQSESNLLATVEALRAVV